jgi:hypothetical protein
MGYRRENRTTAAFVDECSGGGRGGGESATSTLIAVLVYIRRALATIMAGVPHTYGSSSHHHHFGHGASARGLARGGIRGGSVNRSIPDDADYGMALELATDLVRLAD